MGKFAAVCLTKTSGLALMSPVLLPVELSRACTWLGCSHLIQTAVPPHEQTAVFFYFVRSLNFDSSVLSYL